MRRNVYLAAYYSRRDEIKQKAIELEGYGINITSSWLDETVDVNFGEITRAPVTPEEKRSLAIRDVQEIKDADVLVLFTEQGATYRGGRHFESGFAFGEDKRLIICGERENIFHYLPGIEQYDTWDETVQAVIRGS